MKLKVLAVMLGVGVLAGCAGQEHLDAFRNEPLVKDVHYDMSEDSVREIGGPPASVYRRKSRVGTCYNYVLRSNGKHTPYYVGFNAVGLVDQKGFMTCREFDQSQNGGPAYGDPARQQGF